MTEALAVRSGRTTTTTNPAGHRLPGLDALRVAGSLFVLYQHFAGWMDLYRQPWIIGTIGQAGLVEPLRLDPYTGFTGVCVFYVISGIVVTHATYRETVPEFLGRRATRILPTLWVAVVIGWLAVNAGFLTAEAGQRSAGASTLLWDMTLANYPLPNKINTLPVSWTLTVEIPFYLITALMIPLLRRWPWLPPAIEVAAISVALSVVNTEHTPATHLLRLIITLLPALLAGQLISLVVAKRLHPLAGVGYGVLLLGLFIRAGLTSTSTPGGQADPRVLVLVVLVAILATRARGRFARSVWVSALAKRTYSLYLVHLTVAFSVLDELYRRIGEWPALALSLTAVALITELLYRCVEKPTTTWFRTRGRRSSRPPRADIGTWAE